MNQNMMRQLCQLTIRAPKMGASAGATTTATAKADILVPRTSLG